MDSVKHIYLQKLKSIDMQTNYFMKANKIHTSDATLEELQNDLLEFTMYMMNEQVKSLDDDSKAIINLLFFEYDNYYKKNANDDFDYETFATQNDISFNQVTQLKDYVVPIYHEILKIKFKYDCNKETYFDILPKICDFLKK
jgi:hypothetical protein